jgi:hypothetical protein
MSCVFQNSDPPPPSPPGECVPPDFVAGGGHTRRMERGVVGQYFGRRKTQLCSIYIESSLSSIHKTSRLIGEERIQDF